MKAKVHEQFSIFLDSNPTAGYSWEAAFDASFLKLEGKSLERSEAGTIGIGGKEIFTFLPVKAGKTTILMSYKRPWESKTARDEAFEISIGE